MSDQEESASLLEPLKDVLPLLKLIWGASHYGGLGQGHLGIDHPDDQAHTVPKRGLLVNEGEEVDWDKLLSPGFRPLFRRWVTYIIVHH